MKFYRDFNKPEFRYGERVYCDMPTCVGWGTIVGKASSHIIDLWIVDMDNFPENWKYKSITVPHTYLGRGI